MLIFSPQIFIYFFVFLIKFPLIFGSDEEERLMVDIFRGYNSLILPMRNSSQPLTVKMGLQLLLLINVDEKDQIMQSNVWLTLKWHDFQLKWNPVNYGGVKDLRVSLDKVWLPDIVLFNNADGNYEVSYMSNVVIQYNGDMLWVPPAIYKSSCIIDVEYFPFDEQICHLIFGSWTYNEKEIKMDFDKSAGIDLLEYGESKIWDVVGAPATLVNQRSRIEYQLRLRRKALFYTVVLIIPTVLMAFLSMAISVLLSIVVFLLLVSKILPPTSSTIPLMAKYLLLTFVLNVITILVTVIIINIYFRSPITHQMPGWVRSVFLK
uniref:Uncharacterized protein n=1 Tax=Meloidogyne enterolobii TaxID=390850 RepID=A0A6V7XQQ2_MELEN|nr:unnamed protein product [Meloidogyne enterolobii]